MFVTAEFFGLPHLVRGAALTRGVALIFAALLTLGTFDAKVAVAGCGAPEESVGLPGGVPGRLDPWRWWTLAKVQRTYEGGQFTYYQLLQPARDCEGPNCRGSDPESELSVIPLPIPPRTHLSVVAASGFVQPPTESRRHCFLYECRAPDPVPLGLDRPPAR